MGLESTARKKTTSLFVNALNQLIVYIPSGQIIEKLSELHLVFVTKSCENCGGTTWQKRVVNSFWNCLTSATTWVHEYMIHIWKAPFLLGAKKLRYQRMHHTFWSNFDARFWKTGWWFYEQMRCFGELLRDILGKPRFRWPKRGCIWEVHGMKLKAQWGRNGGNEAGAGVAQIGPNIS